MTIANTVDLAAIPTAAAAIERRPMGSPDRVVKPRRCKRHATPCPECSGHVVGYVRREMVPRGGIEPPTHGFSVYRKWPESLMNAGPCSKSTEFCCKH